MGINYLVSVHRLAYCWVYVAHAIMLRRGSFAAQDVSSRTFAAT